MGGEKLKEEESLPAGNAFVIFHRRIFFVV
jgi:hypothetical protein